MHRRSLIAGTLCSALIAAAHTAQASSGPIFIKLELPFTNARGTLVKLFSYDCPFCYRFDIGLDPDLAVTCNALGLKFCPVNIESRGRFGRCASEFFALSLLKDQQTGVNIFDATSLFRRAKEALYFAYHKKHERWSTGEDAFIATLSDATLISPQTFASLRETREVQSLANSWKLYESCVHVQGVPAYIVHGQYMVLTRAVKSKQSLMELIARLAIFPHQNVTKQP